MEILKDEGGQIVPTERIEFVLIGAITLIILVAMFLKIMNVETMVIFVLGVFGGVITSAKLLNTPDTSTPCDIPVDPTVEPDQPSN
jgi:hypothetical protein